MSPLYAAAMHAAGNGWPVFPVARRGKLPLISTDDGGRGYKDATTDLEQVNEWWSKWPQANIGFHPGPAGLIVIDIDGEQGRRSAEALDLLPRTTRGVNTPRPGLHLYFRRPTTELIGNIDLGPELDVRCDHGYVVLPPSVHPNGKPYSWAGEWMEITALPDRAVNAVMQAIRPTVPANPEHVRTLRVGRRYVTAAMERELDVLQSAPEGDRNNALNRAAFALARFVPTGDVRSDELYGLLYDVGRAIGLTEHETRATLRSAFSSRDVGVPG